MHITIALTFQNSSSVNSESLITHLFKFLDALFFLVVQSGKKKNLPAMQDTWVRSLGQKVPLEKEMATYSSILAWRIPWTKEAGRLWSIALQELDITERLNHQAMDL